MSERASAEIGIKKVTWRYLVKGRLVKGRCLLAHSSDAQTMTEPLTSPGRPPKFCRVESLRREIELFPRSSLPAKRQGAAIEGAKRPRPWRQVDGANMRRSARNQQATMDPPDSESATESPHTIMYAAVPSVQLERPSAASTLPRLACLSSKARIRSPRLPRPRRAQRPGRRTLCPVLSTISRPRKCFLSNLTFARPALPHAWRRCRGRVLLTWPNQNVVQDWNDQA